MINRQLVRRKAMMRLMMGRLFPGIVLALIAEIVLLAVSYLQNGALAALSVSLPKTLDVMNLEALEKYILDLLADKYAMLKIASVFIGGSILNFLVSAPLRFGTLKWYWVAANDKTEPIGYALNSYGTFKEIGKSLWIYIYTGIHYIKWAILCYLPAIAVMSAGSIAVERGNPTLAISLMCLGGFIAIGMTFLWYLITNRYFLAPYLYAQKDISAVEALRESVGLMRGRSGDLFIFRFTLVLVEMLALLFCSVASILVIPYVSMCEASYAAEVICGPSEQPDEKIEYTVE